VLKRAALTLCFVLFPAATFADSFTYNYGFTAVTYNPCGVQNPCPPVGLNIGLDETFRGTFGYTPSDILPQGYLNFTIAGQAFSNPASVVVVPGAGNSAFAVILSDLSEIPALAAIAFPMTQEELNCFFGVCPPPPGGFNFDRFDILTFEIREHFQDFEFDGPINPLPNPTYYLNAYASGPVPVPEPSTWLLLGSGVLGICLLRRKRVR
jgi:hypothetical protein